ncbi:ABC transporter ATP-binding protein/permease [Amedibacillus sp. YH-ame6]
MLKLVDIKKTYIAGNTKVDALKGINLQFRKKEFVAILGASGCGKTTLLNLIGGLDHYTSGNLIIDNVSTKDYKDKDWDAYRNNCVGFIFQSYNLIGHINVLTNVEMSMTLSGYSHGERKKKALEALDRVGLKDQAYKKPNQLSGGQMQRVAIARALVNDPEIILADEPTGALDSVTSVSIMELIKEIASEKLVIMVTHNPDLAKEYANRIVEIKDGEIMSDSNPLTEDKQVENEIHIKKTAMNYITALSLSFNNIKTKKGRTLLTAFASSIGIIGIALIMSLSNGFQMQIDTFERDSLSQMPISVSEQSMEMDPETMMQYHMGDNEKYLPKYTDKKVVTPMEDMSTAMLHTNDITKDYIEYVEKIDKTLVGGISYMKSTGFNVVAQKSDGTYATVNTRDRMHAWQSLPDGNEDNNTILANYDVLAGKVDTTKPGLVLMVDSQNRISEETLTSLGFKVDDNISFEDILNKELKIVSNDDYYVDKGQFFTIDQDYESLYKKENAITVKVSAILRGKEDKELITSGSGVGYTSALTNLVIEKNKDSKIVKMQEEKDYNVLTGQPFETGEGATNTKENTLAYLGADSVPAAVYIYPKDFASKDEILAYLDDYNEGKTKDESVLYTDMAEMISSLSGDIMNAITIVLVAFSAISLIVSSIMIGIITYISVLERTKEIGVLRALGARKRDISRVFNAETLIVGLCSGLLGILIAQLLTIPANIVIEEMSGLANVAQLNPMHGVVLILISMTLTLIGGFIPSKIASKKDPVTALRTE